MFESLKNNLTNYKNTIKKNSLNELIKTIKDYYYIFNNKLEDYLTDGDIEGFINLLKDELKSNNSFELSYAEIVLDKIRIKEKLKNNAESFTLGESSIKNILSSGVNSYKIDNLIASSKILTDGLINGISPKTIYSLVPALTIKKDDIFNITVSTYTKEIIFQSKNDEVIINKMHDELVNIGVISMRDAMELRRLDNNNYENNLKEVYEDSKIDYSDKEEIEFEEDEEFENYNNIIDNIKRYSNNDEDYDDEEFYDDEY